MPDFQKPKSEVRLPLPRSVWILSWVSFFADVSSEMMYPLLPLFLVTVVIDGNITVEVVKVQGNRITIGIQAPSDVKVLRGELKQPTRKHKPLS